MDSEEYDSSDREDETNYEKPSHDCRQDESRASRVFSAATPLNDKRRRLSKVAAMYFIKTVCTKGRKPSPQEVIKVKQEAMKLRCLKDFIINLGHKVPNTKDGIKSLNEIIKKAEVLPRKNINWQLKSKSTAIIQVPVAMRTKPVGASEKKKSKPKNQGDDFESQLSEIARTKEKCNSVPSKKESVPQAVYDTIHNIDSACDSSTESSFSYNTNDNSNSTVQGLSFDEKDFPATIESAKKVVTMLKDIFQSDGSNGLPTQSEWDQILNSDETCLKYLFCAIKGLLEYHLSNNILQAKLLQKENEDLKVEISKLQKSYCENFPRAACSTVASKSVHGLHSNGSDSWNDNSSSSQPDLGYTDEWDDNSNNSWESSGESYDSSNEGTSASGRLIPTTRRATDV